MSKKVFSDYYTIDQKVNLNNSNKRIFSLFDISSLDKVSLNNYLKKYNRKLEKYYKRNIKKRLSYETIFDC